MNILSLPTFTKSVKVGSPPELDQLISAIAHDAEKTQKERQ